MASIRSFSDILLDTDEMDDGQRRRFLGIIQKESLRLTRLLDGILDLNQLVGSEQKWEEVVFDPDQVLDQAIESCEALAFAAGVTLKRSARARKTRVRGNRDKLAQVFINLISNAIKYNTSNAPQVTVSSAVRKGFYEASVSDNGPGIPESERERIFARFARGPMPREVGSGLGLAISRQIVERLRGTLTLSASRKTGAEFVIRLEVAPATE